MPATERRRRDRAERHRLIITAARDIAEAEGWDAVTTRRLADRVEYSQPVLYSHFANKDAIRDAVAIEGFGELANRARTAREAASPADGMRAVAAAYLEFAATHPAVYHAMFGLPTQLKFASPQTPPPLREAFNELVGAFGPVNESNEALAELLWGALHGLAVLSAGGRIPPQLQRQRLDLLITLFSNTPTHPSI